MNQMDNLILFEISKRINSDLINVLCVSKEWFSLFFPFYKSLKPFQSLDEKYNITILNLKLGYKYNKLFVLHNILSFYNKLDKKKKRKLLNALTLKLYLDKPFINFVPLNLIKCEQYMLKQLKIS